MEMSNQPDGIVRLLVREHSGLWYVDQGYMLRSNAVLRIEDWRKIGFAAYIQGEEPEKLRIVPRPNPPIPWKFTRVGLA